MGVVCLAQGLPELQPLCAPSHLGAVSIMGLQPQVPQPAWSGFCSWRSTEKSPQPGISHPSVHHMEWKASPRCPFRNMMHSLRADGAIK